MSKLGDALRKKYKTPRAALRALGLDEKLLDVSHLAYDGALTMKATKLEYLATTRIARAVNPLLAFDAQVDYRPLTKGLTTKNFAARKPQILSGLKTMLKGKTLAADAELNMENVKKVLELIEHFGEKGPSGGKELSGETLDESATSEQHKAMEAAAHGKSNLGIPKEVGKEFADADKGKSFDEMIKDWAASRGMSDDDVEELKKMHTDSMPGETALDAEDPEEDPEKELDAGDDDMDAEDEDDEFDPLAKAKDKKGAKDRMGAKDKKKGAMDRKVITQDELSKAVQAAVMSERKHNTATAEAREFVRPYVGELPLALDSAEKVYRAAAGALEIEDAATVHPSALKVLIKTIGRPAGSRNSDDTGGSFLGAMDRAAEGTQSFEDMFPGAGRIGNIA